jgi:hypothetical protein
MKRTEPVPRLLPGPAVSRLARTERPWSPTPSSLSDHCPWRPYSHFYYGSRESLGGNGAHLCTRCDDLAGWEPGICRASWPSPTARRPVTRVPCETGEDPAINRCMQVPDQTARRGHAAFAGWCSSAARCCSLRSQLRSRGGSPTP